MAFDTRRFDNDTPYDPSEFNIAASDAKGHSISEHFRYPQSHRRAIQQIVTSRRFPYAGISDAIRHAVYRHIEWLLSLEDIQTARTTLSIVKIENERMKSIALDREMLENFNLLQKEVSYLLSLPDGVPEARRIISRNLSAIRQAPEGFYRDQYLAKLEAAFGYVLDGKVTPRLRSGNGQSDGDENEEEAPRGRRN